MVHQRTSSPARRITWISRSHSTLGTRCVCGRPGDSDRHSGVSCLLVPVEFLAHSSSSCRTPNSTCHKDATIHGQRNLPFWFCVHNPRLHAISARNLVGLLGAKSSLVLRNVLFKICLHASCVCYSSLPYSRSSRGNFARQRPRRPG